MNQMMFYVNMVNTKVVDNFLILLVLKFNDFAPNGLGFIDFRSLLSGFAGLLNRSEWFYCLAYLNMESCIGDNRRVVLLFIKFHDFRPTGLGVIDFTNLLSTFACALNRSEWLLCLTHLNMA